MLPQASVLHHSMQHACPQPLAAYISIIHRSAMPVSQASIQHLSVQAAWSQQAPTA